MARRPPGAESPRGRNARLSTPPAATAISRARVTRRVHHDVSSRSVKRSGATRLSVRRIQDWSGCRRCHAGRDVRATGLRVGAPPRQAARPCPCGGRAARSSAASSAASALSRREWTGRRVGAWSALRSVMQRVRIFIGRLYLRGDCNGQAFYTPVLLWFYPLIVLSQCPSPPPAPN